MCGFCQHLFLLIEYEYFCLRIHDSKTCDNQLLIGVHFVAELSAPTLGPRRENMVLVLSLA